MLHSPPKDFSLSWYISLIKALLQILVQRLNHTKFPAQQPLRSREEGSSVQKLKWAFVKLCLTQFLNLVWKDYMKRQFSKYCHPPILLFHEPFGS